MITNKIGGGTPSIIPPSRQLEEPLGPKYYSRLQQRITDKMPNKATGSQITSILKEGVSKDEIKWTGLEDLLKEDPTRKFTKQEINKFLEKNKFVIVERTLDESDPIGAWEDGPFESGLTRFYRFQESGPSRNYREIIFQTNKGGMISGHFEEDNFAHARVNDRIDMNGDKNLFAEEVQSDLHEKGRKEGYAERSSELMKVPDAPFKSDWHELVMRRLLREAAEKGYDRLSWTTGEMQAERYDLAKQVDEIRITNYKNSKGNYIYKIEALKDRNILVRKNRLSEQELSDHVGKDLAKKAIGEISQERVNNSDAVTKTYFGLQYIDRTGLDQKLGGKGMVGFYDKILVDYMNKFSKKFGVKVDKTEINLDDEGVNLDDEGVKDSKQVHSIKITPEMRRSLKRTGVPISANISDRVEQLA